MKKINLMMFVVLLFASCQKENISEMKTPAESPTGIVSKAKVTRLIADALESDPDPNPTTECGSALFYGTMTHLGNVHGISVNKTCNFSADGTELAITSDEITYAANGDQLWTKGSIVIHFPLDGSTIATITGGATIVGGTGRFEGATGYFVYHDMVYDLVTGHESHTATGEITY